MTEEISPLNVARIHEQGETALENQAKLLAGYYHTLLEENIPDELAAELVVSLQKCFLNTASNQ